jgi:hypothetical protein
MKGGPAPVLIVIGLLLGPVHFYFWEQVTGRVGGTYSLGERAARWQLPDGAILRITSGLAFQPLPLELNPERNLYRLRLHFAMAPNTSAAAGTRNAYQLSVLQGDVAIFERGMEVSGDGEVSRTLPAFEVSHPGSYVLLLEEVGKPPLGTSAVKVELIEAVEKPRMWVAWCGVIMLGFGVVLVLREVLQNLVKR